MTSFENAGLVFDYTDNGPKSGETVVLLHGFPGDSRSWEKVTPILTAAGYRVLVPMQRGYSPGARPLDKGSYRAGHLVSDISALLDHVGVDRVHLVGHDWGGSVAWGFAASVPERLASLTVVSTPHPLALMKAMRSSLQALRFWYIFLFQLPRLPEAMLRARGGRPAAGALISSGLDKATAQRYIDRLNAEPHAATGALNWYRALPLAQELPIAPSGNRVPTLYVWGTGDTALGRRAADLTARYVTGPYVYTVMPGASHWIPENNAGELAEMILSHIANTMPAAGA